MNWTSVSDFLAMGGYGFYVWGSYLVTALVIGLEATSLIARHRTAKGQGTGVKAPPSR